MRMVKSYDIDELLEEISSEEEGILSDIFGCEVVRNVLERELDGEEVDDCEDLIFDNVVEIVKEVVKERGRGLTEEEAKELESKLKIEIEKIKDAGIEMESVKLVDENGEEYEMVEEDPRQMKLFDDGVKEPLKIKRYIKTKMAEA